MKGSACLQGLLSAAVLTIASPSWAQQPMVLGFGTISCGTWLRDRRTNPSSSLAYEGWITGFLTEYNVWFSVQMKRVGDVTQRTDVNGVFGWIDTYCAGHPLTTLYEATQGVIEALSKP